MAPSFTVLIVEDVSEILDVLVQVLLARGLRVFAARNGYEALPILRGEPVDLLLADIVMPGMDGVQLATQAKLIRPGIKVLFATGYAQKATERNAMRLGPVLFKPIRQPQLIREVEMLLGPAA